MTVLVVASRSDPASMNIASQLKERRSLIRTERLGKSVEAYERGNVVLVYVEREGIHSGDVDRLLDAEAIIFASKHRSEAGEKALTVHTTGNPTHSALYGGQPKSLSRVDPRRMRSALLELDALARRFDYKGEVTFEATHHGPTELRAPTMFVEIGSAETDWGDPTSGAIAAEAIWKAATQPEEGTLAVGFGGGHYPKKHANLVRQNGYAVGHILSKYFFDEFDAGIVGQAFEKTVGKCTTALIDWKGMRGPDRANLLAILKQRGVEVVRI